MKYKNIDNILAQQEYMRQNVPQRDPFDQGIMRAIKSSKESVAMDEDQEQKALRNSLLSFGENLNQMPKTGGFVNNLVQAGKAMGPAIRTYDQHDTEAKKSNYQNLIYAQQLRAQDEAKIAALEKEAYTRDMAQMQYDLAQQKLDEQRRYHEMKAMPRADGGNVKENLPFHQKEQVKSNIGFLKQQSENAIQARAMADTLDNLKIVLEEAKDKGLVGSNIVPLANRHFAQYISGDTKELNLADMAKIMYIQRIKQFGGSNPSTYEVQEALKTIPSYDKNPDAALEQIEIDKANALNIINKYNTAKQQMQDNNFQGYANDIYLENPNQVLEYQDNMKNVNKGGMDNARYIDEDIDENIENDMVKIIGPNGRVFSVPKSDVNN